MSDQPTFYHASEELHSVRLLIGICIGLVISLGLGYLYNLFSTFIPFIYFNVLITVGLGMAIGLSARIINKICHLNNKKSRLILVATMVIFVFLFQWIAYLSSWEYGSIIGFMDYLVSIPKVLFSGEYLDSISDLYTYGSWSIGSFVFNQFSLVMVWLVEFGIMAVLPIMSVLKVTEFPYSENFNCWYPKFTLSDQFESVASKQYFLKDHIDDIVKGIHDLAMGNGMRHGKIHIYYLEAENIQYLSFEKVFYEDRGKGKKTSNYLIENLKITTSQAKIILNEFNHKKEKFEIF